MPRIKLFDFNKRDTDVLSEIIMDALQDKEFNPTGFNFTIDVDFTEEEE